MSRSFCTDLLPASDRLDAWLCNARQICGDCRFDFPKSLPFRGSIERRVLAGMELTRFSSTPVSFAKFPVVNASAQDRGCVIITQLQGVRRYSQSGKSVLLTPSDTTVIDAGQPWTSECAGGCTRLYVRLPRWVVQDLLRSTTLPVLPYVCGRSGMGATLFHFTTALYQQASGMSERDGDGLIPAYLDVLAGCVLPGHAVQPLPRGSQLRDHVERLIEGRLSDPTLSPTQIAAAVGISVRHLHRLFGKRGCTVAEWIWQRRLERCRADLSNPCKVGQNITEIAFFWGFSDSAHFSHSFRKCFGVSPREFRSNAFRGWATGDEVVQTFLPPRRQTYPN